MPSAESSKSMLDLQDVIGVAGVGLVSYGAWLVVPAAGFITCGFCFILIAVFSGRSN